MQQVLFNNNNQRTYLIRQIAAEDQCSLRILEKLVSFVKNNLFSDENDLSSFYYLLH